MADMSIAQKLLRWYDAHGRDLPWRKTRDPYAILVSEIMLQQTQVSRGLTFYARWLKRFPTWQALAKASNAQVLKAWAGLGYNRRALMLRDIARQICVQGVPTSDVGWRKLKGIGPYTSAAIALFAQHERIIPIDTNIRRVLARVGLGLPYPSLADDERIAKVAETIVPKTGRYDDFFQAIFDLATSVCMKTPDCARCPLRTVCKAAPDFLAGNVATPKAMIVKAKERKHRDKSFPDRIYRGRILTLVRKAKDGLRLAEIGKAIDPSFQEAHDGKWVEEMVRRMEKDGMVKQRNTRVFLA